MSSAMLLQLKKPLLKLTDDDFNEHSLQAGSLRVCSTQQQLTAGCKMGRVHSAEATPPRRATAPVPPPPLHSPSGFHFRPSCHNRTCWRSKAPPTTSASPCESRMPAAAAGAAAATPCLRCFCRCSFVLLPAQLLLPPPSTYNHIHLKTVHPVAALPISQVLPAAARHHRLARWAGEAGEAGSVSLGRLAGAPGRSSTAWDGGTGCVQRRVTGACGRLLKGIHSPFILLTHGRRQAGWRQAWRSGGSPSQADSWRGSWQQRQRWRGGGRHQGAPAGQPQPSLPPAQRRRRRHAGQPWQAPLGGGCTKPARRRRCPWRRHRYQPWRPGAGAAAAAVHRS